MIIYDAVRRLMLAFVFVVGATTVEARLADDPPGGPRITLGIAVGVSREEVRVPVYLTNETGPAIGGLQMAIVTQDISHAGFVRMEDRASIPGFTIQVNEQSPGRVNFVVFGNSNAAIPPGADPVQLAVLIYSIDSNTNLASSNTLDIEGLLAGDVDGSVLAVTGNPGLIHV